MYQARAVRRFNAPQRRSYLIGDVAGTAAYVGSAVGIASGIPGGTIVGGILGNLLGGGSGEDQKRQARANDTLQKANAGSPLAAALIFAAPSNVSGHEIGYWQQAMSQLSPAIVTLAQQKYGASGYWPTGQPDFYNNPSSQVYQQILNEVRNAGGANAIAPNAAPYGSSYPIATVGQSGTSFAPNASWVSKLLTPTNLAIGAAVLFVATRPRSRRRR